MALWPRHAGATPIDIGHTLARRAGLYLLHPAIPSTIR